MDGRGLADIRPLDAEVQVIPRVHGSAIFQRGETQILGVTTLNMLKMEQQIDSLSPVTRKRYMHHYNFPPYSNGATGRVGSPKRRESGHGSQLGRATWRERVGLYGKIPVVTVSLTKKMTTTNIS